MIGCATLLLNLFVYSKIRIVEKAAEYMNGANACTLLLVYATVVMLYCMIDMHLQDECVAAS